MSKLTKRLTAMLLAGMLIMGSASGSVFAAEMDIEPRQTSEVAVEEVTEESADTAEEEAIETSADATVEEEAEDKYYTVTLDANGGYFEKEWDDVLGETVGSTEVLNKSIPIGEAVNYFPMREQENAVVTFIGWSLEREGEILPQKYIPVENCVLYAVWEVDEYNDTSTEKSELPAEDASEEGTDSQAVESADTVDQDTESVDESADQTEESETDEDQKSEDTVEEEDENETADQQGVIPDQKSDDSNDIEQENNDNSSNVAEEDIMTGEQTEETTNVVEPVVSSADSDTSESIYSEPKNAWTTSKVEYNGHTYQRFDESKTWKEAESYCESLGGHLATITTEEEKSFIAGLCTTSRTNYWIGGTDERSEGEWRWITGEEWKYTNWHDGEPSNAQSETGIGEDYLQVSVDWGHTWNDSANKQDSTAAIVFICEWDNDIIVNPIDISAAEIKLNCQDQFGNGCDCFPYTGEQIKPEVLEVKVGTQTLTLNTDYTISYGQNIKYGEATVTINGTGNYSGEKVVKFMIVPDKVKNLRYADTACGHNENNNVGSKHRVLDVVWDAVTNVPGYWVEYSNDPEFSIDTIVCVKDNKYITDKKEFEREQHIYVRAKAYISVNGSMYFGAYSDVLEYEACDHLVVEDFWGFKNKNVFIQQSYYANYFTPAQANVLAEPYSFDDNSVPLRALCYGMSYLAVAILNYGYPPLSAFNVSSLYEIKSYNEDPLVKDYLFYAHIMQNDSFFTTYKDNVEINNIDSFISRVEEYTKKGGHPVTIGFQKTNDTNGESSWKHALVALDIVEKNDSKVLIRVYDPNCLGVDMFLEVTGEHGVYTKWKYSSGLGTLNGNTTVTRGIYKYHKDVLINESNINSNDVLFVFAESTNAMAASALKLIDNYDNRHYTDWLISVSIENNVEEQLTFFDFYRNLLSDYDGTEIDFWNAEQADEETKLYFWVPKTIDNTLNLEGAPAGSRIHIAGNKYSVTVQTDAQCDLSICLPETGEGKVRAISDGKFEIQSVFVDFDEDGDRTKVSYNKSGNAQTPVDIFKHVGDLDAPLHSGTCGNNLTWSFDESGILRISGTGVMYDYDVSSNKAPWLKTEIMTVLKSVIIKNGVTKIGDYAFFGCNKPTSVWIPDSVVSIGKSAFFGCRGLEKVTIPEGVTSIGANAFGNCTGVDSIEISSSVESIGTMAFTGCTNLTNFNVDSDNAIFSSANGALLNKDHTELIYCPSGKKGLYSVPDGVVKIGTFALDRCSGLTGVSIPDGVSEISGYAFGDCTGLTSIVIPSSVTRIWSNACYGCTKLSVIYFIGTEEDWNSINFSGTNSELLGASIVYVDDPKSFGYAEVTKIPNQTYTGKAISPDLEVYHLCNLLKKGKDYKVSYFDNVGAGTATVKISGAGEYTGEVSASFTIDPKSVNSLEVSGITSKTYTGNALTQTPVVKLGTTTLNKDTDYTVSYSNNTNAGTATVTITGIGNYEGTKTVTFTIKKAAQSITASNVSLTYLKTGTIAASGNKGTLSYKSSNTAVATVDSTGKVTAKGAGTVKITITAAATSNYNAATKTITVTVAKAAQSITAKSSASSIAVGKTATVSITGAKGTKSYKSSDTTIATVTSAGKVTAKKVGTVKITATSAATANYKAASKTVTIKVVPAATASLTASNLGTGMKLTWKKVAGATGYKVYRGSTLIKTITSGSTVTFADAKANTNGTKYTFKVVATASTGISTLSKSVSYYRIARPAISSVTNSAAGRATVKWGKNATATGYQIQYSLSSTFASGNKILTLKGAATVSKVITSLTKGKTYYIRMRTYKTVGSTNYWSLWSTVKAVKISK